jgi:hypothetical protein
MTSKLHIVLIIPRGEAVRNFLFSDTLRVLAQSARVTLLSVVTDEALMKSCQRHTEEIIALREYPRRRMLHLIRDVAENAHGRWLWSKAAQSLWKIRNSRAQSEKHVFKRTVMRAAANICANRFMLERLTAIEQKLDWTWRSTREFDALFDRLKPDVVFNGSHIHGLAAELPAKVAHFRGIPTIGFIFSWDNLYSRGRIFVPYDEYLVWNPAQAAKLLELYPRIAPDHVHVTGTPQFDFHTRPENHLSREELCEKLGVDPHRPLILYTTGMATDFPDEYRTVEYLASRLHLFPQRPQLVVRTYVKGTDEPMRALACKAMPGVVFPAVEWEEQWFTPKMADYPVYTSLLRHAALGINAASTVSLELMMHDKPVVNLAFDPPGSDLPREYRWSRHLAFDHYVPVAASGGVMVAHTPEEMLDHVRAALEDPARQAGARAAFIRGMMGDMLDGNAGRRIAECLLDCAQRSNTNR